MMGSSDTDTDSDGDTWSDYDEVVTYLTNPAGADTDGDGDRDNTDTQPLVPKVSANTDLYDILLHNGSFRLSLRENLNAVRAVFIAAGGSGSLLAETEPLPDTVFDGPFEIPYDTVQVTVTPMQNLASINIENRDLVSTTELVPRIPSVPIPLKIGTNKLTLGVMATDETTDKSYNFDITSTVPSLTALTASAITGDDSKLQLTWTYPSEEQLYNGMFIVRNTSSVFGTIPASSEGLSISDGKLFGYPLVTNSDTIDISSDEQIDTGLSSGTTYYYCAVLYSKKTGDSAYHFGKRVIAQAGTNDTPEAVIDINTFGILTVSESDSGDSEFSWSIKLKKLDQNGIQIGSTITLAEIPGTSTAPIKAANTGQIYFSDYVYQVAMNSGQYVVFGNTNTLNALYIGELQGFPNTPKEELTSDTEGVLPFVEGLTEFKGWDKKIRLPQTAGYKFQIMIDIYEYDSGAAHVADRNFTFAFNDHTTADGSDDTWDLETTSDLSNTGSSSTTIYSGNTAMNKGNEYTFNPYFSDNSEGKMQVFFKLRWSE